MAFPVGLAIGLGSSLIGGLFGASQRRKAARIEANAVRPVAEVNRNLLQNLAQAQQMAQVGLPQQQYINAIQNIQRNQNAAFRVAGNVPGTSNVASILRASNDAISNLDIADARAREQNQRLLMGQRQTLAQEENRVIDYNERQLYEEQIRQAQALRGAGNQNLFGALGMAGQIGINAFGGGGFSGGNGLGGLFNGLFGGGNTGGVVGGGGGVPGINSQVPTFPSISFGNFGNAQPIGFGQNGFNF